MKGAQAIALAIFLARRRVTAQNIKVAVTERSGYDLDRTPDDIRPTYRFNETCQETVPQGIIAFLESESFEDAIRKVISIGGDSDTLGAITGGITQAFYGGVSRDVTEKALELLDDRLRGITVEFMDRFCPGWISG